MNIPKSVELLPLRIFDNSWSLEKVVLNEGLKNIDGGCFVATKIQTLTIPATTSFIGGDAFYACNKLESVIIKGDNTKVVSSTFRCSTISSIVINNTCKTLSWADTPVDSLGNKTTLLCDEKIVYIYPKYLSSLREQCNIYNSRKHY